MDDYPEVPREEAKAGYDGYAEAPYTREWHLAVPWMAGMVPMVLAGLAFYVLGAFLHQIWATTEPSGDGLLQTGSWFAWIGRAAVGLALVFAAIRPSPATPPIRLGLVALGILILLGSGLVSAFAAFGGGLGA